jgi:hypothetical protein
LQPWYGQTPRSFDFNAYACIVLCGFLSRHGVFMKSLAVLVSSTMFLMGLTNQTVKQAEDRQF